MCRARGGHGFRRVPPPQRLAGPLHVHDYEDGISYVLDGALTFQVGSDVRETPAGESVALPRLVPHRFWNAGSEPARVLDVVTPGGLVRYYEELAGVVNAADAMNQVSAMEAR
jgi:quercetin dioxygenase-like cupin family protein